eukprot:COSAG06_NODE_61485_length_267_cov_1.226190_1_plen_79_part_01
MGHIVAVEAGWGQRNVVSGQLSSFAKLGQLRRLNLQQQVGITGDISVLGVFWMLEELRLEGTSVFGAPESLGGLSRLRT